MTTTELQAGNRPAKIALHHLERWAIVYVRQSHPQQVQRHRESAQVQANLQQLALGLGLAPRTHSHPRWRSRIAPATSTAAATISPGCSRKSPWATSGMVLGFQINRLAREDEACCRLIRICAAFRHLAGRPGRIVSSP